MKFAFDLCRGDQLPSKEFVGWVPKWWYRSVGLPIEKGVLPSGEKWLLAGWFLSEENPTEIISRFRSTGVERLFQVDGQFILAIYTEANELLEIYRDRTGILPIFYSRSSKRIALSAGLGNVRKLAGVGGQASESVLDMWPFYRASFPPDTPYDNIRQVSGRRFLSIKGDEVKEIECCMDHWTDKEHQSIASASTRLGEALSKSVGIRVGMFRKGNLKLASWLSGGNDSSLLVALARQYYVDSFRTVFVSFEDMTRDYGEYASEVAKRFETEHCEVRLSLKQFLDHWSETIDTIQAPLNHPSTIGQSLVLKMLSGRVDVMLDGLGADTVFGGPYWGPMLLLSLAGKVLPEKTRSYFQALSRRTPGKPCISKVLKKSFNAIGTPLDEYIYAENSFGDRETINRVFGNDRWRGILSKLREYTEGDPLRDMCLFDLLDYTPADVHVQVQLGMNRGVICMFPFLDYGLICCSLKMPIHLRYHYFTKKAVLKKYATKFFGHRFVYKPKEGFGVPLGKWVTRPEFEPFLKLTLEGRSLRRGWWKEGDLRRIIKSHQSGEGDDNTAESIPWITTNLELWARICLEGESPELYKI